MLLLIKRSGLRIVSIIVEDPSKENYDDSEDTYQDWVADKIKFWEA